MAVATLTREYEQEALDFKVWARWANRSDQATIMRICGLTVAGSIPTWSMGIPTRTKAEEDKPDAYGMEAPPEPPVTAYTVQDFMELLNATSPEIHKALVARHLRRVGGEYMVISSEGHIAARLYEQPRQTAHPRLIKDCAKGYEAYRIWTRVEGARVSA